MTPFKIVFLTTGLNPGGAETQLIDLALQLKKTGWDIRVVSMLPPVTYIAELERENIPAYSLEMKKGRADPRGLFRLVRLLNRIQPQILHSHMVHANILGRIARLWTKIPVLISTAHNTIEGPRWREFAYRYTDFLADLTTNVSRVGVERYISVGAVPEGKIRWVPNGVDTEKFRPDPALRNQMRSALELSDQFVWLAAGRIFPQKNYPLMLQAFAISANSCPNTRLLIAGDGPARDETEMMAKSMGIGSQVKFLGHCREICSLMNAADGFLNSSIFEGFPVALLEASATGLPVLATDVGGSREIVLTGKSGFITPPGDPKAMAAAMIRTIELDNAEQKKMGMNGRNFVIANFSLPKVVNLWEALYREQLQRKGIKT